MKTLNTLALYKESMNESFLGLIPARSGSKRIIAKNVRPLAGVPLLAYAVCSALDSRCFEKVVVSTDSPGYADIATLYGADVIMRPEEYATDVSPDIDWVEHALKKLPGYDVFAILRPTSPFRKAETIQRAMAEFLAKQPADSLRAVERCHEHPAKMWTVSHDKLHPLLPIIKGSTGAPGHSSQYASLPEVYVQNASLEIAWTEMALRTHSIAGEVIVGFKTFGEEGVNIDTEWDFAVAEKMVERHEAKLPPVHVSGEDVMNREASRVARGER